MNDEHKIYLSLEFTTKNNTYWLTSGDGSEGKFYFIEIPKEVFNQYKLTENNISLNEDYSDIRVFDDRSLLMELTSDKIEHNLKDFNVSMYKKLSWEDTFYTLAEQGFDINKLSPFFHNNIVVKYPDCQFKINEVPYKVTAFLPDEFTFAIYGADYTKENPNWITIKSNDINDFLIRIHQFKISAIMIGANYFNV